jgi:hypothetical protein
LLLLGLARLALVLLRPAQPVLDLLALVRPALDLLVLARPVPVRLASPLLHLVRLALERRARRLLALLLPRQRPSHPRGWPAAACPRGRARRLRAP